MEVPPKTAPRLFLIDAYALIYRAFFAFIQRPLINSKGENTSAPFGFTNFLLEVLDNYDPDYLAVVFDAGSSQREEIYPAYKATRNKMPDELKWSLPRIWDVVEALGVRLIGIDGWEADDVIGTLAVRAAANGMEAVIVSGDKDFYQLVGPRVHLMNPGRGGQAGVEAEWIDEANAPNKFGVAPDRVVDYLALIGDSSDNVPGAPGIGPKTALALIEEFGSVEDILAHAAEIQAKRPRESLLANADGVRLSRQLVTIRTDVPVDLDLDALRPGTPDHARLRELFVALEFRVLVERFTQAGVATGEVAPALTRERTHYVVVIDPDRVRELTEAIRERGWVSLHCETTAGDPMRASLVGISLAVKVGEAYYLPFGHCPPGELDLGSHQAIPNLPALGDPRMTQLRDLLEDPTVRKVGQDLKRDLVALWNCGVQPAGFWFDTMVASYVLNPGRRAHTLEALALDILAHKTITYAEVTGRGQKQISFAEVQLDPARDLTCEDADCSLRLYERFQPELEQQGMERLFHDLEMPLIPVLARMESAGIRLDEGFFREMSRKLNRDLELIQQEIWKETGVEFNLNSNPQLREILFEKLALPVLKKTKTGPSTDAAVLEELAALGYRVPVLLMEYREMEKLRGTYVDALPRLVNPRTGRLHTSFNQAVAATGRLSSSDPNLQNIPIRTQLGREIRKGFIADEGHLLMAIDYSQIELRILAHFSGDEPLLRAFREGIDVHRQTASVVFDIPIDQVTPDQRGRAKTINFATLYGQGPFALAQQLGISRDEAKAFIAAYFERFSGVRRYLDEQIAAAHERGYVETLLGRRRFIPELQSRNWNIRQFGERVAQNTPIQGTAADLIKKAMIDVDAELQRSEWGARLLLTVHDELLFEVPKGVLDPVRAAVVERMEHAIELAVPIDVDVGVGKTWYEAKA
ncbi:MAG: DNA polymerase I [Gemmatimonadetes bacterium]|nr:DNA polymerase I [Gemmatimonadota bacterium]